MFGLILCMYKIETLLDQVSSVCGLSNRLNEIHAKSTLNHWTNRQMVPCFCQSSPWSIFHKNQSKAKL